MELFDENDVKPGALKGERIAVLGYGSQGRAHAMNLRDSGFDVVIGLRPGGKTATRAKQDGFNVQNPIAAVEGAGLVAFLVPDMAQAKLYADVEGQLRQNCTLLFAHGFNIHFGHIRPRADLDVVLIAPKGPGRATRPFPGAAHGTARRRRRRALPAPPGPSR